MDAKTTASTPKKLPVPRLPKGAVFDKGSHTHAGEGSCAMEWVYQLDLRRHGKKVDAETELTDSPACTSLVIAAFVRSWNDSIPDADTRARLLGPLIPLLLDTAASAAVETRRSWMAIDWLVRTFAPAWLDLAGQSSHASALRDLPELESAQSAKSSQSKIDAAWAAARIATRAAARAAARDATAKTVQTLQRSAVDLIVRMCAEGKGE